MNEKERTAQFQREARAFFTALYGHADLREREALAAFLRRFAEHCVSETQIACGQFTNVRLEGSVAQIADFIKPFEEKED